MHVKSNSSLPTVLDAAISVESPKTTKDENFHRKPNLFRKAKDSGLPPHYAIEFIPRSALPWAVPPRAYSTKRHVVPFNGTHPRVDYGQSMYDLMLY